MILKIHRDKYYGYKNKTKELFKRKYRSIRLKWMENVELEGSYVDGWFSSDKKEYLLKLIEEGDYKRFTGNSVRMFEFLIRQGAIKIDENEKGEHINYNDEKGFISQESRFGRFVGADLWCGFRTREMIKKLPNKNWGIVWTKSKKRVIRIKRIKN